MYDAKYFLDDDCWTVFDKKSWTEKLELDETYSTSIETVLDDRKKVEDSIHPLKGVLGEGTLRSLMGDTQGAHVDGLMSILLGFSRLTQENITVSDFGDIHVELRFKPYHLNEVMHEIKKDCD